ncbi:MAG: sodium:proton antiporter [Clostridia bacterium]|nr:sodium:proton antiporter [Clostridia bacterium]
MNLGHTAFSFAHDVLLIGSLFLLAVLLLFCLIRAIIGPRIADRLLSINMGATMTIAAIAILAVLLDEDYLVDISLLYAMISFLAVVVLSRIYRGAYLARKDARKRKEPTSFDSEERES